jgi:adenylate kinase family enzyme
MAQRIAIIGNGGGGKTTLARKLAGRYWILDGFFHLGVTNPP